MRSAILRACLVGAASLAACHSAYAARPVVASKTIAACARETTYAAPYEEQVCYSEPSGYTVCRWLPRTHIVTAPADCGGGAPAYEGGIVRKGY